MSNQCENILFFTKQLIKKKKHFDLGSLPKLFKYSIYYVQLHCYIIVFLFLLF